MTERGLAIVLLDHSGQYLREIEIDVHQNDDLPIGIDFCFRHYAETSADIGGRPVYREVLCFDAEDSP